MAQNLPYDKTNPNSIEEYAKMLIGKSFEEILLENASILFPNDSIDSVREKYENANRKGGLGNFLEELYFMYKSNSNSEADFAEAGLELKATPYEKKNDGTYVAGERLSLGMISYKDEMPERLEDSHIWQKCKLILLIYYLRNREVGRLNQTINFVWNFTPSDEDLEIIKQDYKIIADKVRSGRANEISESDTTYLGASTKGATAERSTVPQERYAPNILARKRSFCYKQPYMTYVLNRHINPESSIGFGTITNANELKEKTFETILSERLQRYVGKTENELCTLFDISSSAKSLYAILANRMLGTTKDYVEELEKAGIEVKSIRIEENGKIREHMSFPKFEFKELAEETWEESQFYNKFSNSKFLFLVFRKKGNNYYFKGSQLWNMPEDDLEKIARSEWERAVKVLKEGVKLYVKQRGKDVIVENNFPSASETKITHIRPHTSKRYYVLEHDERIGNGTEANANELPDGRWMIDSCFWLNKDYIMKQLKPDFFKKEQV